MNLGQAASGANTKELRLQFARFGNHFGDAEPDKNGWRRIRARVTGNLDQGSEVDFTRIQGPQTDT
jgi:hypothetical protein